MERHNLKKTCDQHKTKNKSHSTNYAAHGRSQQYYEKQKNDGFFKK
jgi:hypothetical protein